MNTSTVERVSHVEPVEPVRSNIPKRGSFSSLVKAIGRWSVDRYIFRNGTQELLGRKAFFYNAFRALSYNGINGDYVEFGSCGGRTFFHAFRESKRHGHNAMLWAFDSFEGLPEPADAKDRHPAWRRGAMATSLAQFVELCNWRGIARERYRLVPGFYNDTLPLIGPASEPCDIALAYIDCDLYSSTKTVLEFLVPRIKHGMILAFDDYFCWSATHVSGERKAALEAFPADGRWELVPFMRFGWAGNAFVVEDRYVRNEATD